MEKSASFLLARPGFLVDRGGHSATARHLRGLTMADGLAQKIQRSLDLFHEINGISEGAALQRADDVTKTATRWFCCAPWILRGLLGTQILIEQRGDDELSRVWDLEKRVPDLDEFASLLNTTVKNAKRVDGYDDSNG